MQKSTSSTMITFAKKFVSVNHLAYAKKYRPLYDKSKSVLAGSVYTENKKTLLNAEFATEQEQQDWFDNLIATIRESGMPSDLVVLPDGSFIKEKLIKYGASKKVDRGYTIELYDYIPSQRSDKPLVTALVETEDEVTNFFKILEERLKAA